ncbi:hypothetical protein PIB30_073679 [Stylosanthes scabra]|uniref:Uncharacterized protein n=1 Tax=Stylosanthes scabra TaxID=79078 RepID=A0ABU6SPJ7_9FABA|nr:hypothetical protein [Stylosanthes scabra]
MDGLLLEVLREQKNKGQKEDRAFSAEAYKKSNPKFRQIRGKPLHHLDIVRDIYEKDIATGNRNGTAKERLQRWSKEKDTICYWYFIFQRQASELFDAIRNLGVQDHKLFEAVD